MNRPVVLAGLLMMVAASVGPVRALEQTDSPLAGLWTLNRSSSEFPSDIGFNADWMSTAGADAQKGSTSSAGRGRRGGGTSAAGGRSADPFQVRRESYDDARRAQLLTGEVRNPPVRLMIVDTPAAFTITNELGQSRTFHPDGKEESVDVQGVPITVTTRRDGDQVVILYHVEQNRELRYTFSQTAAPKRLIVDIQFLEHGAGDKARRVYDAGIAAQPGRPTTPDAAPAPATASKPAADAFDQRPNAELIGLRNLGIVVEDFGAQAVACGLNHDAIESALSKRLTDAGFAVRRNSDEDTYLYVNIISSSVAGGTCVSRYDAFLYSHATAKLPYGNQPALVQVSLMHRGGIGSSAPAGHGTAVLRGLEGYIDLFVTQIHDANK